MLRMGNLLQLFKFEKQVVYLPFFLMNSALVFSAAWIGTWQLKNIDLVILAIVGQMFCLKNPMRGGACSVVFLLVSSLFKHAFWVDNHLWQLGIECSLLVGLALTAFLAEMFRAIDRNNHAQLMNKEQTILHLEEEIQQIRQNVQQEQVLLNQRLSELQKDNEEKTSEISAVQILNDVLRKNSAQLQKERDEVAELWKNQSNERLVFIEEKQRLEEKLQERKFVENRYQDQIRALTDQNTQKDQMISIYQERLQSISSKEALYHELKKQLDEKNRILAETRIELFRVDTALQAMRLEREREKMEEPPLAEQQLEKELIGLEDQYCAVEKENEQLLEIVELFSKQSNQILSDLVSNQDLEKPFSKRRKRTTQGITEVIQK